ncbi:hydrolase [Alkalimarinus coralli]|uniref:hydrolase n=1 Tax=Alkalimarinus coralli TaxID=2935863 RepID=UPI00202B0D6E|nr:hydrolase [Alkalimarinus coralli]
MALAKEKSVLVIVDVQGKLARIMSNSDALIGQLGVLIEGAKLLDMPIIWLEQLPDKLGPTVESLAEKLLPEQPIAKSAFSGYGEAAFRERLKKEGRTQVILAGIETHVCVYQTAQDLLENDYKVTVVADAVSSRSEENKQIGLQMMTQRGAKLSCVEAVLFELQQKAEGEAFRGLIKLIK